MHHPSQLRKLRPTVGVTSQPAGGKARPGIQETGLPVQPPKCGILCQESAHLGVFHLGGWVSDPQPLPPVQQMGSSSQKAPTEEAQGCAAPKPCLQPSFPSHWTKHILGMQITELLL